MTSIAKATIHIDNDRVIVTEYSFKPGDNTGWHRHGHDYVIVPITDGHVRLETPSGPATDEMKKGVPYFRNESVEHDVINAGDVELRFIEVEIRR